MGDVSTWYGRVEEKWPDMRSLRVAGVGRVVEYSWTIVAGS